MDDEGEWEHLPITFEQALTLYKDAKVYWLSRRGRWYEWAPPFVDLDLWEDCHFSIKVHRDEG